MEHISTIIAAAIVGLIVAAIVIREIKNRKSGKCCSCSGNCDGCTLCHRDESK